MYGPKFTPTPKENIPELEKDIQNFCRKLRLAEFFAEKEPTKSNNVCKLQSKFNPGRNRDTNLDNYIDLLTKIPLHNDENRRSQHNTSREEWQALQQLKNDPGIIIKEADKGGAFVIMDTTFYQEHIMKLLNDETTYEKIHQDREHEAKKKLEKFVKKYDKILTKEEQKFISDFDMKTSNIYGLPKIHKSKQIIDAINTQNSAYIHTKDVTDLKFRPIIAGPTCPTSHLSELLDEILKPFLKHVKSYIRDDQDFINKLDRNIKESDIFATFDVESLYTNIEHQLGKTAVSYWIDNFPHEIDSRFTKNMILEAMDTVLKTNIFMFDKDVYIQLTGTAMGTKMAPTYANLTLGYLENKLYDSMNDNPSMRTYVEKQWKRYLDDAYITWDNDFGDITSFAAKLNDLHPKITFTQEVDKEKIAFLDIKLIRRGNGIITDIYHKTTDTFNYLPFKSCHPRHIKQNIPFTLARRIRMLCEDEETRKIRYTELAERMISKGFPSSVINKGIEKAEALTDDEINTPKNKDTDDGIVAVSTHNPNNPSLEYIVKRNLNLLESSPRMGNIIRKKRVIFAKRQPPNLKGLLCRAAFASGQQTFTVSKCGKNCETCKLIEDNNSTSITTTGKIFHVKCNMNCNTKNVIYLITCKGCKGQYVGETGNELKTRMTVHRQQIRDRKTRKLAVSEHIATCGGGKFSVFPLYKLRSEDTVERRIKEEQFITMLKPVLNAGNNLHGNSTD